MLLIFEFWLRGDQLNKNACKLDSAKSNIYRFGLVYSGHPCSHERAVWYFISSINKCSFRAFKCDVERGDDVYRSTCISSCDGQQGCASNMGFRADQNSEDGFYYVDVSDKEPYCESTTTTTTTTSSWFWWLKRVG